MSNHKITFTLRQHTPMIHFQHDQPGATLRATELKPKLDRFLLEHCPNIPYKKHPNGKRSIDYRITIDAKNQRVENLEYRLMSRGQPATDNKGNPRMGSFPTFFANMGDDWEKSPKKLSFADNIFITINSFDTKVIECIRQHFPTFLNSTNFGMRQSKGFGSFSVWKMDGEEIPFTSQAKYLFRLDLSKLNKQIDRIQERDADVHRVILGIDPLDQSKWNSGVGGYKKYKGILNYSSNEELVKETLDKVKKLERKIELQNESLDTLEKLAVLRADRLACIPSIKPIREDKLKRKISYLSGFGYRVHPIYHIRKLHKGIDFTSPKGTHIQATGNGIVKSIIRKKRGYGLHVIIDHGYGYETLYGHMSKILVKKGQKVVRGQTIGLVGNTGSSTAPHCHYEVHYKGKAVNPIDFVFDGMSTEEYSEFVKKAKAENQSLD